MRMDKIASPNAPNMILRKAFPTVCPNPLGATW